MSATQLHRNLDEVERLAGLGADWETVAHFFGLTVEELDAQNAAEPAIEQAFRHGKALGKVHVMEKLRDKIDKGSFLAMQLFLKSQAGWTETTKTEVTGAKGGPVEVVDLGWAKDKLMELMAKRVPASQ
jgi:hypothetical protein